MLINYYLLCPFLYVICSFIGPIFFTFFFSNYNHVQSKFYQCYERDKNFIFKKYYERAGFPKENNYYAMKRQKKRLTTICNQFSRKNNNPSNSKE